MEWIFLIAVVENLQDEPANEFGIASVHVLSIPMDPDFAKPEVRMRIVENNTPGVGAISGKHMC